MGEVEQLLARKPDQKQFAVTAIAAVILTGLAIILGSVSAADIKANFTKSLDNAVDEP